MTGWWDAIQTCIWIATRDIELVGEVRSPHALGSTDGSISGNSFDDAERRAYLMGAARSVPIQKSIALEAPYELSAECGKGSLTARGRLRGKGDLVEIPTAAWANLVIHDQQIPRIKEQSALPIRAQTYLSLLWSYWDCLHS